MRRHLLIGMLLVVGGSLVAIAAAAQAANVSHPATYTGTAATGGSVEFDVSADGSSVTRFSVKGVSTTCGEVTGSTTGSIPIANDAFQSSSTSGLRFKGTFPAPQKAQGTLSLRILGFPSCTSADVNWSATTPTPPPDTTAPQTKLTSGPSGKVGSRKATFRFSSSEPGSTFQCKLDGKAWAGCKSPRKYSNLKDGKHTFKVRARDAAGNVDSSPAKRSWRVDAG